MRGVRLPGGKGEVDASLVLARLKRPVTAYVLLMCVCLFATVCVLFATHGEAFSWFLFKDGLDTGMDFFHSIEYTKGRSPYEQWHTIYPPLANALFYLLFRLIPTEYSDTWATTFSGGVAARGTSSDLRVQQAPLVLFIVCVVAACLLLFFVVRSFFDDKREGTAVGLLSLASCGVIYAIERGNCIILALICVLFFFAKKDSESRVMRELALIALAVAFALKLYPALFGIVLLRERRWMDALRCALYGIAMFILPFLLFKEGLGGLPLLMEKLLAKFTAASSSAASASASSYSGFSIEYILNTTAAVFGLGPIRLGGLGLAVKLVLTVLLLGIACFARKEWQSALAVMLSVLLVWSQPTYIVCLALVPSVLFLSRETNLDARNAVPFVCLVILQITIAVPKVTGYQISAFYLVYQLCIVALFVYVLAAIISELYFMLKPAKGRHAA